MARKDINWIKERPIAHRGFHDMNKQRWENTLPAFKAARDRGFGIECDVHMTADNVPLVFHDNNLKRLTGTEGSIYQKTAAEMQALRIGGTKDAPPTLEQLLDLVGGKVPLVIELKGIQGFDNDLVAKVGKMLNSYKGPVAIMSFDHWLIRLFPELAPDIPCGLTAMGATQRDYEAHFSMLGYGIDFVSYCLADMPNPFVSFVREKLGMPVITWTVNDEAAVKYSYAHGDQITFEGFDPADFRIA